MRNWFEIYFIAFTALSGLLGFLLEPQPGSIVTPFPHWVAVGWFGGLLLGGVIALLGALTGTIRGMFVQRAGLVMLCGLCAMMGIAGIATASGLVGCVGVGLVIGYAVVCALRARQLGSQAIAQALLEFHKERS